MSYALSFKAGKCFVGSSADKAVLRCLCDYANDDGSSCRPATSTISAETELNKKTVYKSLSSLSQAGWIEVSSLNGRQNFYTINVTKIEEAFIETTAEKRQTSTKNGTNTKFGTNTKNGTGSSTKNGTKTTTNFGTGTKNGLQPVPNLVHNSVNTQSIINTSKDVFVHRAENVSPDTSKTAPVENDGFTLTEPVEKELTPEQKALKVSKHCPQQKLIDLYHECLPGLPPVRIWTSASRVNNLAARWREMSLDQGFQSEADGLDFFKRFFEFVGRSKFLMGQVKQKDGRTFRADLEWITKANNFEKICDRKYHDR
nr:MAG TPA: helix-turn-helix domain protein [Caudoviricetes sp.]